MIPVMPTARKKKTRNGWLLFWLVFLMGITLLFMMNLERIKDTLQETHALEYFFRGRTAETEDPPELEPQLEERPSLTNNNAAEQPRTQTAQGEASRTEKPPTQDVRAEESGLEKPGQAAAEPKTVERSVYLMKVDNAGSIYWTRVKRVLPASDRPLQDALESLIKGPSADEEKQGFISLIPKNARILNATVRGNTAYISFSEDFLFNTYGTEGYASQRRQIVLTATEFSNVKDVQILIDGKRVDYLGEGVWIGSPVSRAML